VAGVDLFRGKVLQAGGCWCVPREKYRWPVADKPNGRGAPRGQYISKMQAQGISKSLPNITWQVLCFDNF
jgi:hypothetical protein